MSRTMRIAIAVAWMIAAGTVWAQEPKASSTRPDEGKSAVGRFFGARAKSAERPRGQAAAESSAPGVRRGGTAEHVRLVCRLNGPAAEMANTINQVLRGESQLHHAGGQAAKAAVAGSVVLVPLVPGNRLVISGPPDAVREVRQLIDELDQPEGMVAMEMVIGEAPLSAGQSAAGKSKPEQKPSAATQGAQVRVVEKPPLTETVSRLRLTTMDNQPAFIQLGTRLYRVTSAPAASEPRKASRASTENVGLILAVTPRICPGRAVVMQIDAEQSQPGIEGQGVAGADARSRLPRSPGVSTFTAQTGVRIPDGQSLVLGSGACAGKSDKELLIVITPHIIEWKEAKKTP